MVKELASRSKADFSPGRPGLLSKALSLPSVQGSPHSGASWARWIGLGMSWLPMKVLMMEPGP
jgi:hypothetical protein